MFSISLSVSLSAEHWVYQWGIDGDDGTQVEPFLQQQQPCHSADDPPQSMSRGETVEEAKPPLSTFPYQVDTSYSSLSEQAQEIQRRARKRLEGKRRERMADAESLGRLEAATAREAAEARITRLKGTESLQVLQEAQKRGRRQKNLSIGSDWWMISPPSSAPLGRMQGISGTRLSWDPSGTTVSTPRTPAVGESVRPGGSSAEQNLLPEGAKRTEKESEEGVVAGEDPFDSQLVEGSEQQEARLRESLAKYRRHRIETVYSLFDRLRQRDEQREADELKDAGDVPGAAMSFPSGAVMSSAESWSRSYGRAASFRADDAGSPLATTSCTGTRPWSRAADGGDDDLEHEGSLRRRRSRPKQNRPELEREEQTDLECEGSTVDANATPAGNGQAKDCEDEKYLNHEGAMCGAETSPEPTKQDVDVDSEGSMRGGDGSPEATGQESEWGEGDKDDSKVVMEGLPKAEPDEVEDDWLLN
ncbi:hypothetical protein LTR85_000340 [Meristemomyces frigidus]|nr:hypothetical protein LTR85_000340 [Meristemomyces frigidus]